MMVKLGRFLFHYRGVVFTTIVLGVLLFSRPHYFLGEASLDSWMEAFGVFVTLLGLAVRAVTIGFEYIVRGGRNRQVYAEKLVQGGIYAHTRNPMYLGNGLIILGWALILNAPEFYLVALPLTILFYAAIIAAEEAYLREKFGAGFDAYCANVNRILPNLSGVRRSIADMRFNWRRVLVKEYNTLFLSILLLAGLLQWHQYYLRGATALPSSGDVLIFVLPWCVLYLVVWALKKTRRLEADSAQTMLSA
jgi:protein-S-isoprenylcysteine O-methyltransferase Ste14